MSALTDLFTAMANKIRSKTGTATTYTPLQMVSDGIDDVYAAGYDAGGGGAAGIPITPSNASPVSLTTGDSYQMLANGYAIASYSSATPSNANPFFMQEDEYYKLSQGWAGGYLIGTYDQITPSNSSPVSLSSGSIYKMGGAGKAVASVTDITPSASAQTLSSGSIYKMGGTGYVYNAPVTAGYTYGWDTETTLWTNSSPTSSMAQTTVTLSQSIQNFTYIKIYWRASTSDTTESSIIIPKDVLVAAENANNKNRLYFGRRTTAGYARAVFYVSNTSVTFDHAYGLGSTTGSSNTLAIPTKLCGLK